MKLRPLSYCFFFLIASNNLIAQIDTKFWFVAPDISNSSLSFDSPVAFTFSASDQPADVTISMPANPTWVPIVRNLGPNQTSQVIISLVSAIENPGPNINSNKGILIESTSPITAYYEIQGQCLCNPDIMTLKGCNGLGLEFFVPMQKRMDSSDLDSPQPRAKFDIVATEDQTMIQITPTEALVGHPANQTFTINLNRGQTYSCHALSLSRLLRPSGSKITSDKPIAVTLSDDLMQDPQLGSCRDLGADQLIPANNVGKEYVAIQGQLNINSLVYIVATKPSTSISVNGNFTLLLNEGQTAEIPCIGPNIHISATQPVYALQLSGIGCEVGLAILNPVDYFESRNVNFVRTTSEPFYLQLVCDPKNIDGFELNGNPTVISPFQFILTDNGKYATASIELTLAHSQTSLATSLVNNKGAFLAGFLHGQPVATGSRYAFFSDFGVIPEVEYTGQICPNDSVVINGRTFYSAGIFNDTLGFGTSCDTIVKYKIEPRIGKTTNLDMKICPNQSISLYNQTFYIPGEFHLLVPTIDSCYEKVILNIEHGSAFNLPITAKICIGNSYPFFGSQLTTPGIYPYTIPSSTGCDTTYTLYLSQNDQVVKQISSDICEGDTLNFNQLQLTTSGVYLDTILSSNSCDTILMFFLNVTPSVVFFVSDTFCDGGYYIAFTDTIWNEGTYQIIKQGLNNSCDTLYNFELTKVTTLPIYQQDSICSNQSYQFRDTLITSPGLYTRFVSGNNGNCDTLVTLSLTQRSLPQMIQDVSICEGDTIWIQNQAFTQFGTFNLQITGAGSTCDTLLNLTISEQFVYVDSLIQDCLQDTFWLNQLPITSAGIYIDTINGSPCDTIFTWQIEQIMQDTIVIDTALCAGQTISFLQSTFSQPGNYQLVIEDTSAFCDVIVHIHISSLPNLPDFLPTDSVLCNQTDLTLFSPYENTIWEDLGTGQSIVIAQPDTIEVTYSDSLGCTGIDTISIRRCCGNALLYIPNVIKPASLENDAFQPFVSGSCLVLYFEIYDRWGDLIFRSNDTNPVWRGQSIRNRQANPGVYTYLIYLKDRNSGEQTQIAGDITVIR